MCVFEIVYITNLILLGGTVYIRRLNNLEQPTSCYFSIVVKSKKVSLHQLNSEEKFSCVI